MEHVANTSTNEKMIELVKMWEHETQKMNACEFNWQCNLATAKQYKFNIFIGSVALSKEFARFIYMKKNQINHEQSLLINSNETRNIKTWFQSSISWGLLSSFLLFLFSSPCWKYEKCKKTQHYLQCIKFLLVLSHRKQK